MDGYWPIFFLLVILKVPAIAMIALLYWAAKNEPENGLIEGDEGDGGQRRPRSPLPRGPRRDPHGGGSLKPSPPRVRTAESSKGRRLPTEAGSRPRS